MKKHPSSTVLNSLLWLFLALPLTLSASAQHSAEEIGIATYYGDKLHGRKTASGELYDKNQLTCAHRTLKFGTKVRVTRMDNGKSIIVRVNDRGPFVKGYIVDLSRKAATEIDMIKEGIVKVKIEVVTDEAAPEKAPETVAETRTATPKTDEKATPEKAPASEKTAPATPEAQTVTGKSFKSFDLYSIDVKRPARKGYAVQIAVISNFENIFAEIAKLQETWPGKVMVSLEPPRSEDGAQLYKLLVGPFPDKKTAEKNQRTAAKKGHKSCFVVNLSGSDK
ncbi:MAG: septal ring lytic transglycosylase RlpA family protein [Saprospiraceae bacterium]